MHGEFRARLAWTLMTLGRAGEYKDGKLARSTTPEPPDLYRQQRSRSQVGGRHCAACRRRGSTVM
eukprot:3279801-Pleurochrysis_carterae.AAC.1